MRIAIIGAGAIGSIIAGFLSKVEADTVLIGRADQVKAIRQKGLVVKSQEGKETIRLTAEEKLTQEPDLAIFTVKTQDLESAYQANHEFLEDCSVLTTQNGVQGANILSTHFDRDKMIDSIVMFGATYMTPGEVTYNFPGDWIIGKPYASNDLALSQITDVLKKVFPIVVTGDIVGMKWLKIFINFNNCIPALVGKSMQETFADFDFCRLSVLLLKEGVEIIRQAGIELVSLPSFPASRIYGMASMPTEQGAGIINKTLTTLSKEPLYGSILQSVLRNKASEIDFINGEIDQVASGIRSQAPLNRKIVSMVHQVENEGRFFTAEEIKKEFNL